MKRVAIVAIVAAGIGLFGSGVRGIAALDGRLAEADDRQPVVRDVEFKRGPDARENCPEHERRDAPAELPDQRRL